MAINGIPIPNNYPGKYTSENSNLGNIQTIIPSEISNSNQNQTGRGRWGPPIWTFFHTLAEKIKPEYFATIRLEILEQIYNICANLPCPECAKHATEYMNALNFNTILTKDDFKNMLFRFHNSVNARKGSPQFEYAELSAKYSSQNMSNVIQQFIEVFGKKSFNINMIANKFHSDLTIVKFKKWLPNNLKYFDP
jgi:hypothetical protein